MVDVLDPTALTGVRTGNLSVSAEDNTVYLVTQDGAIPSTGSRVLTTLDDTQLTPVGPDWLEVRGALAFLSTPGAPVAVGDSEREGRLRGSFNGDNQLMQIDLHSHKAVVQQTPAFPAGAAFHVDFVNQVYWTGRGKLDFTDLITFTGDNKRTYFSSNGVMQTAGTNAPRFNHRFNGSAWVPAGLLIEPAATNLLLRSREFDNASWTKSRTSVTANAIASPDGTTTADKIVEDTTVSATHRSYQLAAKAASSLTRTFSVYLKAGERTKAALRFADQVEAVAARVDVDLSEGTIGSTSITGGATITASSATIRNAGGGWYRCTITATFDATITSTGAFISLRDAAGALTYTGDGASGLYAWGAQVEDGSVATSFIETTTATATRAADVALVSGTNFSSFYNPNEGTFVAEFDCASTCSAVSADDGTNNNFIRVGRNSTTGRLRVYAGGASQVDATPANASGWASYVKQAGAYKANDFAACVNGGTVATDTSGTVPTVTQLRIGVSGAGDYINGHLRRLTYYPTRLSDAQLAALSTL